MRKRILSLLLCLNMVVGMLPTTAFAIWGVDGYYECIFCGAVYYGDDVDDSIYEESNYCCGIGGNSDCWLELHCYECGEYVDRSGRMTAATGARIALRIGALTAPNAMSAT